MKNFFKNIFGKKYPARTDSEDTDNNGVPLDESKAPESRRKKPMGRVYAGPDMINKNRDAMKCVYAGPEMMQKREPVPSVMEEVYMGPVGEDPDDEPTDE